MSQPTWSFKANLGDKDILGEDGGVILLVDLTGVCPPELKFIEQLSSERYKVSTVIVEPVYETDGILSENRFHLKHPVWWSRYLLQTAQYVGLSEIDLTEMVTSDDDVVRASGYKILAEYHGLAEFDCYPDTFDKEDLEELLKKWGVKNV